MPSGPGQRPRGLGSRAVASAQSTNRYGTRVESPVGLFIGPDSLQCRNRGDARPEPPERAIVGRQGHPLTKFATGNHRLEHRRNADGIGAR